MTTYTPETINALATIYTSVMYAIIVWGVYFSIRQIINDKITHARRVRGGVKSWDTRARRGAMAKIGRADHTTHVASTPRLIPYSNNGYIISYLVARNK